MPPQQMTELIDWLLALPTLKLMPNPFREPPEAVVEGGMEAVRRYFTDLFAEPVTIVRRDVKAVILGKGGSGKTRWVLPAERQAAEGMCDDRYGRGTGGEPNIVRPRARCANWTWALAGG